MATDKQLAFALLAAVSLGSIAVAFVLIWVLHYRGGLAWDGGSAEFNWHPLLLVGGLVFLQGLAIIVYRLPWTWTFSKLTMKFVHAGLHLLAFILSVVAFVAVFDFHNAAHIPNMYSLHSWLGLTALLLYSLQLVLGLGLYLIPVAPAQWRAMFMPLHVYSGLFIFSSVIATALMGITEKLIFALSDPKYKDSPPEATFVNILGLLIVAFGALVLWIVTRPRWKRPSAQTALLFPHSTEEDDTKSQAGPALPPQPSDGLTGEAAADDLRRRSTKQINYVIGSQTTAEQRPCARELLALLPQINGLQDEEQQCICFGIMSDKSELKAELERKKRRLAQIREEKRIKEEERKKELVLGLGLYLIPVAPAQWRAAFMPLHVYSGLFIFSSVIATALMGITEKLIFAL
ncbi:Cytochrome b reductase 1 [Merluccius polli]|uniref:Plasma membrane ascorbate-dependent reductase CYBRD1 n=1 Tax=Merluccius polli TaxID=89951 RepID=A0AA47MLX8_MERPO|nr:Cytochrome b reductase 1 [Merluccius polli]